MRAVRLNLYEVGIAESLVQDFGRTPADAHTIVVEYIKLIRYWGGYDNCFDHAERLDRAVKKGITAEMWMRRIQERKEEDRLARITVKREKEFAQLSD